MDLLQAFRDFVAKEKLFLPGDRLLLAVSGGMDSVVLCELCRLAGQEFAIAHCNFRLRGAESERDEQFVRGLAEKYGQPLFVNAFDTEAYAAENKRSIQVAARELRYHWFHHLIASLETQPTGSRLSGSPEEPGSSSGSVGAMGEEAGTGAAPHVRWKIATAHHLDDNIETVWMNFFKGTGMAGLRGMLPEQGKLIRPLLFAGREDLRQFALEKGLEWVEDSSNESDKYTRNYFRHQVIPLVEQVYPGALQNQAENIERFRGMEWIYRQSVEQLRKRLLEPRGEEIHIPVLKLKRSAPAHALPALVYEIIRNFGFSPPQAQELIRLLDSESGRYIRSASHRILKNRHWLIISPHALADTSQAAHILIESPEFIPYPNGRLHIKYLDKPVGPSASSEAPPSWLPPSSAPSIAFLDAAAVPFPLLLRKWKPGDYFYPLGLRKKKKLARFLIDQKLSMTRKEKVWVLESDKKILWVVGLRIDDRYKVTASTQKILCIEAS